MGDKRRRKEIQRQGKTGGATRRAGAAVWVAGLLGGRAYHVARDARRSWGSRRVRGCGLQALQQHATREDEAASWRRRREAWLGAMRGAQTPTAEAAANGRAWRCGVGGGGRGGGGGSER